MSSHCQHTPSPSARQPAVSADGPTDAESTAEELKVFTDQALAAATSAKQAVDRNALILLGVTGPLDPGTARREAGSAGYCG